MCATITYVGFSALDDHYLSSIGLAPNSVKFRPCPCTDMQAFYQLIKSTELHFGLNNASNARAQASISGMPGDGTGTETNASTYDPIGRRYYTGVRVKLGSLPFGDDPGPPGSP